MIVKCPECGKVVGEYTGPIEQGHLIESRFFKYPNGRSPARGSSSVFTCKCKHRFDIIGEMKKVWRTEVQNALQK